MLPVDSQDSAVVSVKDFQAADREVQEQLIPHRPGLYIWTHNIERLLEADEPTVKTHLSALLAVVGKEQKKQVKPYCSITVQDQRSRIQDKKRILLHSLICAGDPLGNWIASIATQVQRPLYVGMALDLNKRINNHLSGNGSDLRQRLHRAKPTSVDMLDLSITWMAAPEPEENLEQEAAAPVEYSDVTLDEDDDQDEDDVASLQRRTYKVGSELDLNLKAAESLLIRLAMPMFNEKQD